MAESTDYIGFAVCHSLPASRDVAIWAVGGLSSFYPSNVNAVLVADQDPDFANTLERMTSRRLVALTADATRNCAFDLLEPVSKLDTVCDTLIEETRSLRAQLHAAYAVINAPKKTSSPGQQLANPRRNPPVFKDYPPANRSDAGNLLSKQCLAHANYLRARWSEWLDVEEARHEAAVDSSNIAQKYPLPETLCDPHLRGLPDSILHGRTCVQSQLDSDDDTRLAFDGQ